MKSQHFFKKPKFDITIEIYVIYYANFGNYSHLYHKKDDYGYRKQSIKIKVENVNKVI